MFVHHPVGYWISAWNTFWPPWWRGEADFWIETNKSVWPFVSGESRNTNQCAKIMVQTNHPTHKNGHQHHTTQLYRITFWREKHKWDMVLIVWWVWKKQLNFIMFQKNVDRSCNNHQIVGSCFLWMKVAEGVLYHDSIQWHMDINNKDLNFKNILGTKIKVSLCIWSCLKYYSKTTRHE